MLAYQFDLWCVTIQPISFFITLHSTFIPPSGVDRRQIAVVPHRGVDRALHPDHRRPHHEEGRGRRPLRRLLRRSVGPRGPPLVRHRAPGRLPGLGRRPSHCRPILPCQGDKSICTCMYSRNSYSCG